MNRLLIYFPVLLLILYLNGLAFANQGFITTTSGLSYKDLKIGEGEEAKAGDIAKIHFVGWLDNKGNRGKELYNSRKEKSPVAFVIGTDKIIKGWNEGVLGMRPGGSRLLRVPAHLGYGAQNVMEIIPPNTPLIFIIELIELDHTDGL